MKVRSDSRPLYLQAEEALQEILTTRYQPGDRLPPEPQLAQQLGISRSTLREAMRSFEERGLITRRQGIGTFVNLGTENLLIESGLESLESVDSLARRKGLDISDRDLKIEEGRANEDLAARLEIPLEAPVLLVTRTKVAANRPVARIIDMIPSSVVGLEELRSGFKGSVLDFLTDRGSPPVAYARARIVATMAGQSMGARLDVSPKMPLLLIEDTLYSTNHEPIEFSRNYFISGFFGFHIIRRIGG